MSDIVDNPAQSNMESFDETHDFVEDENLPCGHPQSYEDVNNYCRCSHLQCVLRRAERILRGRENLRLEELEAELVAQLVGGQEPV